MWTTWTVLNATLAVIGAFVTWVVVIGIIVTRQRDRRRSGEHPHGHHRAGSHKLSW